MLTRVCVSIERLRTEIPEAVAAVRAAASSNSKDFDNIGEATAALNETMNESLSTAKVAIRQYVNANPDFQRHTYGNEEASCVMVDSWRPEGEVALDTLALSKKSGGGPLMQFHNIEMNQQFSRTATDLECQEALRRLEGLEHQIGLSPSEANTVSKEGNISDQVRDLYEALDMICSESKLNELELRMKILGSELEMMEGRGVPADDDNPNGADQWMSEDSDLQRLHVDVTTCDPILDGFDGFLSGVKSADGRYADVMKVLSDIQMRESQLKQLSEMTNTTVDTLSKLQALSAAHRPSLETTFGAARKAVVEAQDVPPTD
uniref:Uncharacterized protein n=1 Tax=Lankesteria abbotti TaxID=340204 RepID=A0A7S2QQP5_9APIC|mmetsp:Transcript_1172/g.1305  ORF Transcript_1172/g.1305 Transcript_1172/m.1305 type:complete len:320 (+) Transcript_1172:89-1048(+)